MMTLTKKMMTNPARPRSDCDDSAGIGFHFQNMESPMEPRYVEIQITVSEQCFCCLIFPSSVPLSKKKTDEGSEHKQCWSFMFTDGCKSSWGSCNDICFA